MLGDLTTLGPVKAWLGLDNTSSDAVLKRLIRGNSRSIMGHLQRPSFLSQTWTDTVDGRGNAAVFLEKWPVTAVASVAVDGRNIPPSIGGGTGWRLQPWDGYPPGGPQAIELVCYSFPRGRLNVAITYTAGYMIAGEAQTVPSSGTLTTTNPQGCWAQDIGVTYASGAALTKVASSPSAGQYSVDDDGAYSFNAADANASILISYSYVPSDIEDACISWVAERYRRKDRLGIKSQSAGGQVTVSYDTSDIPAYIKTQIQPYRRVLPT